MAMKSTGPKRPHHPAIGLATLALFSLTLILTPGAPTRAAETVGVLEVLVADRCPTDPRTAGVQAGVLAIALEGVVSNLIGSGVDAVASYLSAAAAVKSASLKGSVEDTFYVLDNVGDLKLRRDSGCIVLLKPGRQPASPWFNRAKTRNDRLRLHANLPQLYVEIKFSKASDTSPQLLVTPHFLHVSEFLESSWASKSERTYSVATTLRSAADGKGFATATFTFDNLKPGTHATSRTIFIDSINNTSEADTSITEDLNPAAHSVRLDLFPTAGDVEAAASAQKVVAAPFRKAERILNKQVVVAALGEPETALVASSFPADPLVKRYGDSLKAFCTSLDQLLKDKRPSAMPDARCPMEHLLTANNLEAAREAVRQKLELDWANAFAKGNTKECVFGGSAWSCTPPAPKRPNLAVYAWEVVLVETREPTAFATALASAFSANKDKFKTALQDELPSKKAEAKQQEEAAQRDALTAFRLAILDVQKAEAKLAEAATQPRSTQISFEADLLKAKVSANAAARAAKQKEPYEI